MDTKALLRDIGFLVLRVFIGGFLLAGFGARRVTELLGGRSNFPDPLGFGHETALGLAVFAEFGCAILVILGLLTRVAAVPIALHMLLMGFVVYSDASWRRKEMFVVYAIVMISLALTGAGRYSVDAMAGRKK